MRSNVATSRSTTVARTHEGAIVRPSAPDVELRRAVMACLLWEDSFYESGQSIGDRIAALVAVVDPAVVADLAREARSAMKLRHVPLLLVRELARRRINVADVLTDVIQRPDELTEFLALYWKGGKVPLAASVKRGLARAFPKFSAYSLAKYNRADAIKLRDVLFLTHPTPKDDEQAATWKALVDGTLAAPDTWEVALSAGADKADTFARLIAEEKLGALALLRNLRNMQQAGVPDALIRTALAGMDVSRVLPFRFLSAARHAPLLEDALEAAMFRALTDAPKLPGRTLLLVDGSGSMFGTKVSAKSELDRFDAACALAMLLRETVEQGAIATFSTRVQGVAPRRGFALKDILHQTAEQGGTNTGDAVSWANAQGYDRIIVVTDEQSAQQIPKPLPEAKGYIINVASYQNGIGYGPWVSISGWSESIVDYIVQSERAATE